MSSAPSWRSLLVALAAVVLSAPLLWRANNYQLYVLALVALREQADDFVLRQRFVEQLDRRDPAGG